ncbi:hypothetical protein AZF37_06800 [endosymbiont 'TC1' of Trimyema compressum]|uniref:ComF family protein n=1 Tax=endosymbiont 'TC1' of Trimyema compressum TaxID=243899 RepID=UPI0007F122EF|nr:hypothetical protein [endosymbiont 'TC1' of Trimyema compressum]AMP20910.1 hypothetical protein AZF37_06800 [endosymbiont 'TC1' of Trimyema compressum]
MIDFSFELFSKNKKCFICQRKTTDFICQLCNRNLKRYQSLRGVSGYCHYHLYFPSPYTGGCKDLVHRLKYRGKTYLAQKMAYIMLSFYLQKIVSIPQRIVAVPMNGTKEIKRGYNRCDYLGKAIGSILKIPVVNPLARSSGVSLVQKRLILEKSVLRAR